LIKGTSGNARLGIVIQARMGSSRLPGKVLADVGGRTLLDLLLDRLALLHEADAVIVATSVGELDDAIAQHCARRGVACFRGDEQDVLGRFAAAADTHDLDLVVRACADAPFIDPDGIRALLNCWVTEDLEFVHSRHPLGWPVGMAADLMTRAALHQAAKSACDQEHREHVTPYMLANPERFETRMVNGPSKWLKPSHHIAVDLAEDLAWLRRLVTGLQPQDAATLPAQALLDWIEATGDAPRAFAWPTECAS
jgi:spore coat polysaccharide biosynthesis protein SpsF